MLSFSPELVQYVEELLPALRSGTARNNLGPIVEFALAYEAANRMSAMEVLELLDDCPGFILDSVCRELNYGLKTAESSARVVRSDLVELQSIVSVKWDELNNCLA